MTPHHHFQPGEVVHVIIRNPHAQSVAHVQEAAVVQNPEQTSQLALFVYETYYPITDDLAIFETKEAAEAAYADAFGWNDSEGKYDG